MITPIKEATYEEVANWHILMLNRKKKWFVGRTVREGWANNGFKFFSLEQDSCCMDSYKDRYDAIDHLKHFEEISLFVCDNLIGMCDL